MTSHASAPTPEPLAAGRSRPEAAPGERDDGSALPTSAEFADLLWRPLPIGNSFEWTVQRLAQAIRFGIVAPGQRLPSERELADRLRVGRETVREAIRALREAGLVRTARGRTGGTFVTAAHQSLEAAAPHEVSAERVRDVLALRGVLESGAVALAARHCLGAEARRELTACLSASRDRDPRLRRVNDARLHLTLAAASGSPALLAAVADAQAQLDGLLAGIPVLARNLDSSDHQHEVIVGAVLSGDAEKARLVMEEHCEATALLLDGLLS